MWEFLDMMKVFIVGVWAAVTLILMLWSLSTAMVELKFGKLFVRWGLALIWPLLLLSSKGTAYFFSNMRDKQ